MSGRTGGNDRLGRDMQLAEALTSVDPAMTDPNYWLRFRSWVTSAAAPALARRRLMAQLTMGDVLGSWTRTVVPTAMLAAALAGMMLLRGAELGAPAPIGVEELLVSEIEGETIPATLAPEDAEGVAFASEIF